MQSVLFSALLAAEASPGAGRKGAAYEGTYEEDPYIRKGFAADEEGGAEGTCRVHRCAGEIDAYEVDEHECETDCKACEVACALLFVGCAEHYEHEEEGGDAFNHEGSQRAAGIGDAVGAESGGITHCAGSAAMPPRIWPHQ